jgi:hypothetical protein
VAFGVHPLVVWGKCPIEPDEPVRVGKHDAEPYRPGRVLFPSPYGRSSDTWRVM